MVHILLLDSTHTDDLAKSETTYKGNSSLTDPWRAVVGTGVLNSSDLQSFLTSLCMEGHFPEALVLTSSSRDYLLFWKVGICNVHLEDLVGI